MRFIGPPTATVIKKEDKEAKLEAFIDDHIASKKQNDEAPGQAYLLIVRSHESPVVRALARIAKRTRHGEFTIKALVMMPGQDANTDWPAELASITSFRSVPDMRLLDAHEQLWLGRILHGLEIACVGTRPCAMRMNATRAGARPQPVSSAPPLSSYGTRARTPSYSRWNLVCPTRR